MIKIEEKYLYDKEISIPDDLEEQLDIIEEDLMGADFTSTEFFATCEYKGISDQYGDIDSFKIWFEDNYGDWERLSRIVHKEILRKFHITTRDVAEAIVYQLGYGDDYCYAALR